LYSARTAAQIAKGTAKANNPRQVAVMSREGVDRIADHLVIPAALRRWTARRMA
jgi:hypothetical protein